MFKVNIKNTWLFFLLLFKVRRKDTLTTPMASKKLSREALLSLFLRFNIIRSLILSSKLNPFRENALIYFNTFQYSATFSFYTSLKTSRNQRFSNVFRGYRKCCRILESIETNGNIYMHKISQTYNYLMGVSTYHFLPLILTNEQHLTVWVYPY